MPYRIKNRNLLRVILKMDTGIGLGFGIAGFLLLKALPQISGLPLYLIIVLNIISLGFGIAAATFFIKNLGKKEFAPSFQTYIKINWFRCIFYILLIPIFISQSTPIGLFYLVAITIAVAFINYLAKRQVVKIKNQ